MPRKFMGEDFLLQTPLAVKLYEEVKDLPIIDYHCHLDPKEIADNKKFDNITQMWLGGDHYKWRLMRANGVDERYITGDSSDYEKFEKWAETIEECIGSPLYHWTHLEMKRYFNCDLLLSKQTAKAVWDACNKVITSPDFCVNSIFEKFNVEAVCTTDDPADDLSYHKQIKASGSKTAVLPALRPSKALNIDAADYAAYIKKLSEVSGIAISKYSDVKDALYKRIEFFAENGCTLSDHALDPVVFEVSSEPELDAIVGKALAGELLTSYEADQYKTALLLDVGRKYGEMGWTMQLHMNAQRNNNTPMFKKLGPDTGYDAVMDTPISINLARILDTLETEGKLPKTILYSLNAAQDDTIAALIGNYQGGGIKGRMQFGSAWWFNDTKSGMEKQMLALANMGLLSAFVGMLTDSRSFLSYTRHEYFRRIVANLLANWVENGEFPDDFEKLSEIVKNISYYNAKNYFKF